jgi:hypothetical protein
VRLLAEQLLDDLLDFGMRVDPPTSTTFSRSSTRSTLRVGERLLGRADGLLQQIVDELIELRPASTSSAGAWARSDRR